MGGNIADSLFQIPRNSEHGECHFPDVQMGTIVILRTRSLTKRAPRSGATHVQNSSLNPFPIHRYDSSVFNSGVWENLTPANLPTKPALRLKSGAAKT